MQYTKHCTITVPEKQQQQQQQKQTPSTESAYDIAKYLLTRFAQPWNYLAIISLMEVVITSWAILAFPFDIRDVVTLFTCSPKFWEVAYYRQTSNIKRTKYPKLDVSRIVSQLSLRNLLKPLVKSRMKMQLDRRCSNYIRVISKPTKVRLISEVWWCTYWMRHVILATTYSWRSKSRGF